MLAIVSSATVSGVAGVPVTVEVHVSSGLPGFTIVGLPDAACRESRDRVRAALLSSGLEWPIRRVTVNLAPSGVPKSGAALDLAVAVGLLVASEQLPAEAVSDRGFVGELGLDGGVRAVAGLLPLVAAIDTSEVVVPASGVHVASVVGRHRVLGAHDLAGLVACLQDDEQWPGVEAPEAVPALNAVGDLADVRGQPLARTAVEVSAAGGHHLLMLGPPGAGKTMLARRLGGLLPDLDHDTALEVSLIHSAAGAELPPDGLIRRPPVRAPHHGASAVALIGGGSTRLRPGEISLAHRGVLFLDEMGEFPTSVLEALRQPLEQGTVRVTRACGSATFPARFLLVAAMNPCPCGEAGRPGACRCSEMARLRYARRLSGPLLDRFDLRILIHRPPADSVLTGPDGESSARVAERVAAVRERSRSRGPATNAEIGPDAIDELAPLGPDALSLLEGVLRIGALSPRGVQRVRTVALTVADLAGEDPPLKPSHVATALGLRLEPTQLLKAVAS